MLTSVSARVGKLEVRLSQPGKRPDVGNPGPVQAREPNAVPVQRERMTGAGETTPATLGVEEEFHVVDLATRRATARGPELLARLPNPSFVSELHQSIVETNTMPCVTLDDLRRDLLRRRHQLAAAAEDLGLGLLAAGSPPLADPDQLDITAKLLYGLMLQDYEQLAREQVICGCQVHVGIGGRDLAVRVARQVAADLPVLLAASASSPFWHGADTGYASYRTMIWSRWPTAGPFPAVTDAAGYRRMVDDLIAIGVISDPGMIYYDIRPSAHVPTLELRLTDACPRVDDVVLIAGLFRAATARAIAEINAGSRSAVAPPGVELLRAATWRAARSGLTGELVDPATLRPAPATELLARLVAKLRPELEAAGDWDTVSALAAEQAASAGSASRQRSALRRVGSMEAVVDLLLTETSGTSEPLAGTCPRKEPAGLLVNYPSARTDEAMPTRGTPHVLSSAVLTTLNRLGARVLSRRQQDGARHQLAHNVTFAVAGETRPFPIDLVPRVVGAGDWHELRRGVEQRTAALEMFLRDIYGRRAVVRDGVLPASMPETSAGLRPAGSLVPDGTVRACVVGVDVVRDATGAWRVLEDNLRVPSGLAYALQARRTLAAVLPELHSGTVPAPVESAPAKLRAALQAAALPVRADVDVQIALLSQGIADPAWWSIARSPIGWGCRWSGPRTWISPPAAYSSGGLGGEPGSTSCTAGSTSSCSTACPPRTAVRSGPDSGRLSVTA